LRLHPRRRRVLTENPCGGRSTSSTINRVRPEVAQRVRGPLVATLRAPVVQRRLAIPAPAV
jgi:hypothetical protein